MKRRKSNNPQPPNTRQYRLGIMWPSCDHHVIIMWPSCDYYHFIFFSWCWSMIISTSHFLHCQQKWCYFRIVHIAGEGEGGGERGRRRGREWKYMYMYLLNLKFIISEYSRGYCQWLIFIATISIRYSTHRLLGYTVARIPLLWYTPFIRLLR